MRADLFETSSQSLPEWNPASRVRISGRPVTIALDKTMLLSVEDAQEVRRQYSMDMLDQRDNPNAVITIGPETKAVSETFVHALLAPSYQQGHDFSYARLVDGKPGHAVPGSYTQLEPVAPLKLQERANGYFQHYAQRCHLDFAYRKGITGDRHAEILSHARRPATVLKVLSNLKAFQQMADMGENFTAETPVDEDLMHRLSARATLRL